MEKLIFMNDVAALITDLAERYIRKGYVINPYTMGSIFSGEYISIDLANISEKRCVRIAIRELDAETYRLEVRALSDCDMQYGSKVWQNWDDAEVEEGTTLDLYLIGWGKKVFTADKELFAEIKRKRLERAKQRERGGCRGCGISAERIIDRVRKFYGYGKAKAEDVAYVSREYDSYDELSAYVVHFKRRVSKRASYTLIVAGSYGLASSPGRW